MAKRFTDTQKWDDPWFSELPSKYKLFWLYLLDECDHAGIWKVNFRKAQFMVGESLEPSEVHRYMSDRITKVDESYWFVNKFIKFQYGEIKNDRVGVSVTKILEQHKLTEIIETQKEAPSKGLRRGLLAPMVKDKDKDMVKDKIKYKDKDGISLEDTGGKNQNYPPTFEHLWELYGRKGGKLASYRAYKVLTPEQRQKALDHIPAYIASRERRYTKDLERYLKDHVFYSDITDTQTEPLSIYAQMQEKYQW